MYLFPVGSRRFVQVQFCFLGHNSIVQFDPPLDLVMGTIRGLLIPCTSIRTLDLNPAGRTGVDVGKVNIDQLCPRDRVKGRLLLASISGPANQGWGHTRESVTID
jgi:hypothetical protein